MTAAKATLASVLDRHETANVALSVMRGEDLKRAARFWYGTTASNKMRKEECIRALEEVFQNPSRLEKGIQALSEKQRQVLGIFRRYGGAVSGTLIQCEARSRGIVSKPEGHVTYADRRRADEPILELCANLLLVPARGGDIGRLESYYAYASYGRPYPDLVIVPLPKGAVEPAKPLSWQPSHAAQPPTAVTSRPPAAVALDLWSIAQTLAQAEPWKTLRGGAPARTLQSRLAKAVSAGDSSNVFLPPDGECLYYEILRGFGAIAVEHDMGRIDLDVVRRRLQESAVEQGWRWVRTWLSMSLWQDGIGLVSDRYSVSNPASIEPYRLAIARELLAWTLCRVAQSSAEWLDLETFVTDLRRATYEDGIHVYWSGFSWHPDFIAARNKEKISAVPIRQLAYWLSAEGVWAANAILGTLAHLGLVEHGVSTSGAERRHCFRLTEIGHAVFGAPERAGLEPAFEPTFLTVQPNYDILAYLDKADPRAVWPLAQMARRVSGPGERVQTFALGRETVYQAMESGLTAEAIRDFLARHSRTPLPDLVARALAEWGSKREALNYRTDVVLGIWPPTSASPFRIAPEADAEAETFALLPRTAIRAPKGCPVRNHLDFARPVWEVDEEGRVRVTDAADSVCLARLAQFADPEGSGWIISAASVRRARERGIPAEQIHGWLLAHLSHELPPVIETAIRNWSHPSEVVLGSLAMLQVSDLRAYEMIRTSPRFQPLVWGAIPPTWFVVREDKRAELERLLTELGFAFGNAWKLSSVTRPNVSSDRNPWKSTGRGSRKRQGGTHRS